MEDAPLVDETPVGAMAVTEEPDQGQNITPSPEAPGPEEPHQGEKCTSSPEALAFMSSVEPAELQRCVFSDSLATVSAGGRTLGGFQVLVEFTRRGEQPCVRVHVHSHGAIDDIPCGTTVTAFLTSDLELLEEDFHQYVKLNGGSVDTRCHMVQCGGQMTITKVSRVGEEVTESSISYPMSALAGLVTEGCSFLLVRLMALRKKVPQHAVFISLDQQLRIVHTTFSDLGFKQLEAGGEVLDVFGVERTVHCVEDGTPTWQSYCLDDGRLASRAQGGSPATMRLLQPPNTGKTQLALEEDVEMRSRFLDRKEEIKASHALYLQQHPEIRALVSDFLQCLLLRKPDDVVQFAGEYFLPFAPRHPPEPNTEAQPM